MPQQSPLNRRNLQMLKKHLKMTS